MNQISWKRIKWNIGNCSAPPQVSALPGSSCGVIPLTDTPKWPHPKLELDQPLSEPNETDWRLFTTSLGIMNDHCQSFCTDTPKRSPQNWVGTAKKRTKWNRLEIVQHHPRNHNWALPDSFCGGVPLTDMPNNNTPKLHVSWSTAKASSTIKLQWVIGAKHRFLHGIPIRSLRKTYEEK